MTKDHYYHNEYHPSHHQLAVRVDDDLRPCGTALVPLHDSSVLSVDLIPLLLE